MKNNSVTNEFIAGAATTRRGINIYLANGIRLSGHIVSHDDEAILLDGERGHILVFRTSIATIVPFSTAP